ncbi:MAG TPA: N-acetylmuramoyl-L-alanine amidase [Desulfotomaculum sp.]|nr:N-acetylmuramoyl-L-alanine amidase [Desulfotomaculum sp.]
MLLMLLLMALSPGRTFPAPAGPLGQKIVVVDPGHGGRDPGAMSGKTYEKDINLLIAVAIKKTLEESGARVVLTREGDYSPGSAGGSVRRDLEKRLEIARRHRADIFLSVHTNSFKGIVDGGPEVFYHPGSERGRLLAECIQKELLSIPGSGNRSVKPGDCLVLADTSIPSALVEVGFMSSSDEKRKLLDRAYQGLLAEKITRGILQYFAKG